MLSRPVDKRRPAGRERRARAKNERYEASIRMWPAPHAGREESTKCAASVPSPALGNNDRRLANQCLSRTTREQVVLRDCLPEPNRRGGRGRIAGASSRRAGTPIPPTPCTCGSSDARLFAEPVRNPQLAAFVFRPGAGPHQLLAVRAEDRQDVGRRIEGDAFRLAAAE